MALAAVDHSRAPVAYGLRAVPQLFEELLQPATERKKRALNSLCDLVHDPEKLYQTVTGGFLVQLKALLKDKDPSVRSKACELLYLLTAHSIGRRALLSSSLLSPLSQLLDDPCVSCRVNVHRVLNRLVLLPAGAEALLRLVPKLMLKLRETEQNPDEERENEAAQEETGRTEGNEKDVEGDKEGDEEVKEEDGRKEPEKDNKDDAELKDVQPDPADDEKEDEEEEELVLLLSTLGSCSRLDALPALASNGVYLVRQQLGHPSKNVRREAAAAMMALSVPLDGKQQVCEQSVLPVVMDLLRDKDLEVRANAAGVVMNSVITTSGKVQSLKLGLVPVLLDLVSVEDPVDPEVSRLRKALVLYCLRALTSLSEAPKARTILLEQRHLLERRRDCSDQDQDLLRATQTALRVINWSP